MFDIVCDQTPFCISREYVAASETSGFLMRIDAEGNRISASPEAVERLGVHVEWIANDLYTTISPARLQQVCRDDVCVVFRMSCQDLTCTWQATPITDGPLRSLSEVRITASSPAALERAKANVFVAVPRPGGDRLLPLSILHDGDPASTRPYSGSPTEADLEDQADAPRRSRPR